MFLEPFAVKTLSQLPGPCNQAAAHAFQTAKLIHLSLKIDVYLTRSFFFFWLFISGWFLFFVFKQGILLRKCWLAFFRPSPCLGLCLISRSVCSGAVSE